MKTSFVVGGLALGLALAAFPAHAQMVQAGVVIRSGPVAGHVVVGEAAPVVVYREPAGRLVIPPRVVVVERYYVPRGRRSGWWRNRYRPIVVYYDGRRYYDRWFAGPTLRRVEVYERGGRYYRWDDHSRRRDDHDRDHRGHDRDD